MFYNGTICRDIIADANASIENRSILNRYRMRANDILLLV